MLRLSYIIAYMRLPKVWKLNFTVFAEKILICIFKTAKSVENNINTFK